MHRASSAVLAVIATCVATATGLIPAASATPPSTMTAPTGLTVDDQTASGLVTIGDSAPALSWVDHDSGRGEAQSAYQVVVSRAPDAGGHAAVMWDSGKLESAQSVDVRYGGPALGSNTSFTWHVRTWDSDGNASPWSQSAAFETGLLNPSDWSSSWIEQTPPLSLQGANWIWYPDADLGSVPTETRYFRDTVDIPAGKTIASAQMVVSADDSFVLYANGAQVAQTPSGDTWQQAQAVNLTNELTPGSNTIAVSALNVGPSPAGMIGRLVVDFGDGTSQQVVTDGSWKSAQDVPDGWQQPGFDDSGWAAAAVEAQFGGGVWGTGSTPPAQRDPYVRQDFSVAKPVARARLYVAAQGLFDAYLNGARVGDDQLDGTWTDWNKRALYRTFDVTDQLRQGANTLGALLGQGQHGACGFVDGWPCPPTIEPTAFVAQLEVTYADGSTAVVGTDGNWRTAPGPITVEETYLGEQYDARLEQPGWDSPGFDASTWIPAHVVGAASAQSPSLQVDPTQPIQIVKSLAPVKVTQIAPGDRVYDFGANNAGWVRISASAPAGSAVTIKKGQLLDSDGHVSTANISYFPSDPPRQTDVYTFRGNGTETYQPHFVYGGFRYAEITGLPDSTDITVAAEVIHNAAPTTGRFTSSDPMLNKIQQAMEQTLQNSLYGLPASDPTRDKHGWLRDAADAADAGMDNFGLEGLYDTWLDDISDAQNSDGSIPSVAPTSFECGCNAVDPAWASAYPETLWSDYTRYGDASLLASHYDSIQQWVNYLGTIADTDHVVVRPPMSWGTDWQATVATDPKLYDTGFYYEDTQILAQMAQALGKSADAKTYTQLASQIAAGFNKRFFNSATGEYGTGTQLSNAMPLVLGIVPADAIKAVDAGLVKDIAAHNDHLTTGYVGTSFLLRALTSEGLTDVALAIAERDDFPSVGYMLANGPGTLWEGWVNSTIANGTSNKDHPGLAGPFGDWLYSGVAGIQPDSSGAGYGSFTLAPGVAGDLTSASGSLNTPHGVVSSSWQRSGQQLSYSASVPVGSSATIKLPLTGGPDSVVIESGKTIFAVGHAAAADPGLQVLGATATTLTLRAGSGNYRFQVSPAGPPSAPTLQLYPSGSVTTSGQTVDIPVLVRGLVGPPVTGSVSVSAPAGVQVSASPASFQLAGSVWQDTLVDVHLAVPNDPQSGSWPVTITAKAGATSVTTTVTVALMQIIDSFEDGTTGGWQAGANVASVSTVSGFADGPGRCFDGSGCLDALTDTGVAASTPKTVQLTPSTPLDLSVAKTFVIHLDGYGGATGATGYQGTVTLSSGDQTLTTTVPVTSDSWTEVSLDVSSWPLRNDITGISVSYAAVGTTIPWGPIHFQVDDVGWSGVAGT